MSFNLISVYNKADSLIFQSVCLLNKFRTWTGNKGAIYCSVGELRLKEWHRDLGLIEPLHAHLLCTVEYLPMAPEKYHCINNLDHD